VTGVIFDMDGTLSEPGAINYDLMYSRTGKLIASSYHMHSVCAEHCNLCSELRFTVR
jgi:hypothetical protein